METTITTASFSASSMAFIRKLMDINTHMPRKYHHLSHGFRIRCILHLESLIENNNYDNEQAQNFWKKYREMISELIPSNKYPGHKKLRYEFDRLDNHVAWNSLQNNLK